MYNYKARWYSPTLGRFMQTDPIGYGDGMNFYNYAHSDPVNGSDPSGLDDGPIVTGHPSPDPSPESTYSQPEEIVVTARRSARLADEGGRLRNKIYLFPTQSGPQSNPCAVSGQSIDNYLKSKNSPMYGSGQDIFGAGSANNIDPRLIVALAGAESRFGSNVTWGGNNAFNWIKNRQYSSFGEAASVVASGLRRLYSLPQGNFNSQYIGKYCNGPDCVNGKRNMNTFMAEQGGNMNNLAFPCPRGL